MPSFAHLRGLSNCLRISRYADILNSSPRYRIRACRLEFKPSKRLLHRSTKPFERNCDRNFEVNIEKNRKYGFLATRHVNKGRKMSTEQGQTGINGNEKENDDLSLPFWVFLWSVLAILAGVIYTRLNKRQEISGSDKYELKSGVNDTTNDEQIARKLVNEISKKNSGKTPTFRRQRSYEIIDGEVHIHYDMSFFDESHHKRTNFEDILSKSEVDSIPIETTSLDELEFIYPGNLPRIVEEGDEEILESENQSKEIACANETSLDAEICLDKHSEIHMINIAKHEHSLNCGDVTRSSKEREEVKVEHDGKTTNIEIISDEKIIPAAESINDTRKIAIEVRKDNSTVLNDQGDDQGTTNLCLTQNADITDEFSSTSDESIVESLSAGNVSNNSAHSSNSTASKSVYKLTQVEKSEGHNFIVIRREVSKPESRKDNRLHSSSSHNETSFPFISTEETSESARFGANSSQLSREEKCDTFACQQVSQTHLHTDKNIDEKETIYARLEEITTVAVDNFVKKEGLDFEPLQPRSNVREHIEQRDFDKKKFEQESYEQTGKLSSEGANEFEVGSPHEPCVLTCLEEGSDIFMDNSGDILFKVVGASIQDKYLEDNVSRVEKIELSENEENTLDESENTQIFTGKDELLKNWKSLPSWKGVQLEEREHDCLDTEECHGNDASDTENNSDEQGKITRSEDMPVATGIEDNELEPADDEETRLKEDVADFNSNCSYADEVSTDMYDDIFPTTSSQGLVFDEQIKDMPVLLIENRVGSRQPIFVQHSTGPLHDGNEENLDKSIEETSFDVSGGVMAPNDSEKVVHQFSDEILPAKAVETNTNEREVFTPDQTGTKSPDEETFARAHFMEEDVLVAKIITVDEQDVDLCKSQVDHETTDNVLTRVDLTLQDRTTVMTEPVMKTVAIEDVHSTLSDFTKQTSNSYTNTSLDITSGDPKPEPKIPASSRISKTETITKATHSTVRSMVQKFEEERKRSILKLQLRANGNMELNNDVNGSTVNNEREMKRKTEDSSIDENYNNGSPLNDALKNSELVRDAHISEEASVLATDDTETASQFDLKTDINSDSTVTIECLSSSASATGLINDADMNGDLKPDKCISANDQTRQFHLRSDAETIVANLQEEDAEDAVIYANQEDAEDAVIYANQVPKLQATAFDEQYGKDEQVEGIHARPADDVVILGNLTEIGEEEECVIYANELCETETISESNSEKPRSYVRGSFEHIKEERSTTVVYAGHIDELEVTTARVFEENTNRPDHTYIISPSNTSDIDHESSTRDPPTIPRDINSISSELNNKTPEEPILDVANPISSQLSNKNDIQDSKTDEPSTIPVDTNTISSQLTKKTTDVRQDSDTEEPLTIPVVTNTISLELNNEAPGIIPEDTLPTSPSSYQTRSFKETSFDRIPLTSSLATNKCPPEEDEDVFRGETDMDSISDIDEIDVDVLPNENYQKSKSVTDLDEALATFEAVGKGFSLSNDDLDKVDSMNGGLSKSVPDIVDSCREKSLKESLTSPRVEKLQKKSLSLSTPEIGSKSKPGSKKVTKIKIVHVKFLEMQDDSENVEEDSFIYEGDVPISGKIKRRSWNLSEECSSSPVASPPPDASQEIAQERWIAEKTNLKQLEFEFGDLFQNSPSPPPLEERSSTVNTSSRASRSSTETREDVSKVPAMVYSGKDTISSPTPKSKSEYPDSVDCSRQSSSLTEVNKHSFTTSNISRYDKLSQRTVSTQKFPKAYHKTSNTATSYKSDKILMSDIQNPAEDVISAQSVITTTTSSFETRHQSSSITRSNKSSESVSKIQYKNISQNSPRKTIAQVSRESEPSPMSYRYTPGNTHSYSKVSKPVPEGKYVVKYAVIATQSPTKQTNARNIDPPRYTDSPNSSSPSNSPRHGMKLSEKFRLSKESELGETPTNQMDGSKSRGSSTKIRGSSAKATMRQGGRLVTIKSGIISDYECSSDADSEMSYNAPSPRVKAKRYHRPQVHRVDSASSSEPDSPRRNQLKEDRRSMSQLFGVTDEQYSSDVVKETSMPNKESVLYNSRDQKLFSKFEDLEQNEAAKPYHVNSSESNVYQTRNTPSEQARGYTPRYGNSLERNLSPTSFLQEGNLQSDDQMRTLEFNPFDELEGGDRFQPFERCHSPSSVYSDTSSVFSFNCDFDPMPPPTGEQFEPEVYTCANPMCRKQDILLGPEKTSFKSCPACFTYYCSSECRKLHWPAHKQRCYFGRVNTYVKSIIRLCQRREDLSMYLSQLARDGYKKKGRGVVMAIFNNPDLAREFITKGHDAFSGRKPTYSSLAELNRDGIISKHRVALMQAVRDYEPNEEFVFNIAVVATNTIPIAPAPRYKLNTVLHCIKMPLNEMIVARQPKDYDKVETRLFALPKCSRHEFVNEMEARRHYCRSLSKNLRQYNVKLKEDYPECYRKLCMYVEHNISFEPMTVYGQRSGLSYRCVIAPEQSYPLNAEYC